MTTRHSLLHRSASASPAGFIARPRADAGDDTVSGLHRLFAAHHDENKRVVSALKNEVDELGESIDELNGKIAKLSIGGGLGGPAADRRAFEPLRAFMSAGEVKAGLSGTSNPDGGFTVESTLDSMINDQLISISPIRGVARIVSIGSGGDFNTPVGRRGAASAWVGETEARPETATPTLGLVTPPGGELMSYAEVTRWLLDDSSFDIQAWLATNLLDEHAQKEGAAFISGDGIKKPRGFLAGPAPVTTTDATRAFGTLQYVPTGAASTFATSDPADALIDLCYSLAAPYRAGAAWVMNSNTAKTVRKFKDGQDNYLWQPATIAGQPDSLLGYRVVIAEDMPDIGTNAFPVAFGNWQRGYVVVDKIGSRILRDPFTKPGWVKVYAYRRVHGSVTDSNALKLLKISAT